MRIVRVSCKLTLALRGVSYGTPATPHARGKHDEAYQQLVRGGADRGIAQTRPARLHCSAAKVGRRNGRPDGDPPSLFTKTTRGHTTIYICGVTHSIKRIEIPRPLRYFNTKKSFGYLHVYTIPLVTITKARYPCPLKSFFRV